MNITNVSACGLNKPQVLVIGRQLEDNYRQFVFDCSDFGAGVTGVTLVHQRSQDVAPYLVETSSTNTLTWTVTDTDTSYSGYGKAELRVSFSDGLAKSVVFTTMVLASITADAVIPSALQSWYDAMIDYIDENSISPDELAQAIEDYIAEHPIQAPVTSVNGETGDVVLTASDVGALPSSTVIPTRTSQLTNDSGFITSESDPVFTASPAHSITSADITAWNNKSDFSGNYNDLTNKPTIPTKTSQLQNDSGFLSSAVTSFNGNTGAITYTAPVTSVNGNTGAVTISVPTKTSDLTNDSGFITSAPVSSVDGKTGAVSVIPTGGSTGQVLSKASGTNYDVEWINGGGLTQAQINALNGMFSVAAYAVDATAEYAAFCSAFGITQTYTITNTLTHVSNSNTATSISSGTAYTGTLTADTGYTIDSVTITMGGTDITSTAYNAGNINISSVTGNLIITASASGGGGRSDMDEWTDGVAYTDLTVVNNEYVKSSNGTFAAYNGWSRTGFVYCEGASTITFPPMPDDGSGGSDLGTSSAWYTDQNTSTRISNISISKTHSTTVTVPANAKYFAISSATAGLESCIAGGIVPNA